MKTFERCGPDHIPADAVVLHIWMAAGRTVADVACTSMAFASDSIIAEFPRPVPLALERAREMAEHCGLERILVVLENEALWNPRWGPLVNPELT